MSRPVKIIASVVVLALVLGGVAGIAWWTAQSDPNAVETGLYLDGKKVDEPGAMLTIGGREVPFSTYRHYFLLYKSYFEQYYGAGFYDSDPDGDRAHSLKKMVEVQLKNDYAWLDIAAEEGVELDEEDLAEIDATLAEQKETYGAAFGQQLQDMYYLDEANYLEVAKMQALVDKAKSEYQAKLEDENSAKLGEEADKAFQEDNLSAKHILISIDTTAEDQEAAKAEAEAKAQEIYEEIMASEDPAAAFDTAMNEYSEDPGLATNPDGYTFKEGEMVEIFYETTKGLEIGEIAEPVLSESTNYSGYHIIMRMPLTDEAMETNRTTSIGTEISAMVTEKETAVEEGLTVTYPDYYETFTVSDIK